MIYKRVIVFLFVVVAAAQQDDVNECNNGDETNKWSTEANKGQSCGAKVAKEIDLTFPPNFRFGAATASYQIEGAWNVSDKGENIWDRFTHEHPELTNGDTGDVACDSYHKWEDDVQAAADLGLHYYRFSISWPRLLPSGFPNKISEDGVRYYNNLIDGLLSKGIEPVVTLYHWDLPVVLQDYGGWLNPLIADWFADYSRVVYKLYADRVKTWLTINEPLAVCDLPYNSDFLAPNIMDPDRAFYVCAKNLLMAHARAWRIYDEEYKPKYRGQVAIDNNYFWIEPDTPEDQDLTELVKDYHYGIYTDPIYSKKGGWPPSIEAIVAENSKKEGYFRSRLPAFTKEEADFVRGTYDYFPFNYYINRVIRPSKEGEGIKSWPLEGVPELGAVFDKRPEWKLLPNGLFTWYPEGLRKLLVDLKERYGDLEFAIMENGYGDVVAGLEDDGRCEYYKEHLKQVLLAIKEDGVNVTRYTVWSLIDNFEWSMGYSVRFGLYEIDYTDPDRKRIPRKSARYYASVISYHAVVPIE